MLPHRPHRREDGQTCGLQTRVAVGSAVSDAGPIVGQWAPRSHARIRGAACRRPELLACLLRMSVIHLRSNEVPADPKPGTILHLARPWRAPGTRSPP